jgi:hypothetical protein
VAPSRSWVFGMERNGHRIPLLYFTVDRANAGYLVAGPPQAAYQPFGNEYRKTHDKIASMKKWTQVLLVAAFAIFGSREAMAQQQAESAALPDSPAPKQEPDGSAQKTPEKNGAQTTFGLVARRSWFYPDLARTSGPLTSVEKFKLFLDTSLSPPQILTSAAAAGISEARGTLSGYGQGGEGFGKRFGSSMASDASSHFFGTFLLPAMLHEDPRFFVRLDGGWKGRVGHALLRTVVIRTDRGASKFNLPGTLGPLFAEGLANTYLPDSERTAGKTFQRFGIRFGFGAVNNLLREYWPSIFKSLGINKIAPGLQPDPTPPPSPGRPPN